jgi:vacuolar-type H+-ATPase subunit I/STV1
VTDNALIIDPFKDFFDFRINMIDNPQGEYHFITKPIYKSSIDKELIIKFLNEKINVDVLKATKSEILSNIKTKRFNEKICSNLEELKNALLEEFTSNYFKTTVELKHNEDNLNESNSAGINALYYLDIQSYVYDKKLFIIDQPEDDVSQTKISGTLISSLRNFSKKCQIIMITHNPQLVVNLDVDNIIAMKKNDKTDRIDIFTGSLEKYDNGIDMLNIVADTLDGGVDAIKKRWKRYEKRNNSRT